MVTFRQAMNPYLYLTVPLMGGEHIHTNMGGKKETLLNSGFIKAKFC